MRRHHRPSGCHGGRRWDHRPRQRMDIASNILRGIGRIAREERIRQNQLEAERRMREEREAQERREYIADKLRMGYAMMATEDYAGAADQFGYVLEKNPNNFEAKKERKNAYGRYGDQLFEKGEFSEALSAYLSAEDTSGIKQAAEKLCDKAIEKEQQADASFEKENFQQALDQYKAIEFPNVTSKRISELRQRIQGKVEATKQAINVLKAHALIEKANQRLADFAQSERNDVSLDSLYQSQAELLEICKQYDKACELDWKSSASFSNEKAQLDQFLEEIEKKIKNIKIQELQSAMTFAEELLRQYSLKNHLHLEQIERQCKNWLASYQSLKEFPSVDISKVRPKKLKVLDIQKQVQISQARLKTLPTLCLEIVVNRIKKLHANGRFPERERELLLQESKSLFAREQLRNGLISLTEEGFSAFQEKMKDHFHPRIAEIPSLFSCICGQDYKLSSYPLPFEMVWDWLCGVIQDHGSIQDIQERLDRPPPYNPQAEAPTEPPPSYFEVVFGGA